MVVVVVVVVVVVEVVVVGRNCGTFPHCVESVLGPYIC